MDVSLEDIAADITVVADECWAQIFCGFVTLQEIKANTPQDNFDQVTHGATSPKFIVLFDPCLFLIFFARVKHPQTIQTPPGAYMHHRSTRFIADYQLRRGGLSSYSGARCKA